MTNEQIMQNDSVAEEMEQQKAKELLSILMRKALCLDLWIFKV